MTAAFVGVRYQDVERWLGVDDELRIGRGSGADLRLDDENPMMHRRLARLYSEDGSHWQLANEGTTLTIRICDEASPSELTMGPGYDLPIPFESVTLRVTAALIEYRVSLHFADTKPQAGVPFVDRGFELAADHQADWRNDATRDSQSSELQVHGDHRRVLVALSESQLKDPHGPLKLPSRAQLARRFGWTVKAVDKKLDKLCTRFDGLGIKTLKGGIGTEQADRMHQLARFALDARLVTHDDLVWLDSYE